LKVKTNIAPFKSPFWVCNTHVHTIASSLWATQYTPEVTRIEIPTPDDDFLELDITDLKNKSHITVLFHGLEGNSRRYYITNLMQECVRRGMGAVAVNFRGCGSRLNRQPRFYHSGATDDYRTVFRWVQDNYPGASILAAGFSLGANALVKYLAETGSGSPLAAAAAISTPFDLREGSIGLQRGFNRVYQKYFLKTLIQKLEQKRKSYPELPRFTGRTLYDFDNQVTAVIHGFGDAENYYSSCSSKKFMGEVQTPLFLIHAKPDPLCPAAFAPLTIIRQNPYIEPLFLDEGGHVGFWTTGEGWINRIIADWFTG